MTKKTGKLVVLRHGQSEDNLRGILTGQRDTPLSQFGETQAEYAGYLILDIPFDKVYASPLQRAFNTAALALNAAGQEGLRIERVPALTEVDLGDLTGLHYTDVTDVVDRFDERVPGGESQQDVVLRVQPFYERELLPRLEAGENVLISVHAGVVSAFGIMLGARGPDDPRRDIPNATPLVFEYTDGVMTQSYKIDNHLSARRKRSDRGPA